MWAWLPEHGLGVGYASLNENRSDGSGGVDPKADNQNASGQDWLGMEVDVVVADDCGTRPRAEIIKAMQLVR